MKKFVGWVVPRMLLCAAALAALPAFADPELLVQHVSQTNIVNGVTTYDKAAFRNVWVQIISDDTTATSDHVNATGTLTLAGGSYSWPGGTVNGTTETFTLGADMSVGATDLNYTTMYNGEDFTFQGAADTGLNGVAAT